MTTQTLPVLPLTQGVLFPGTTFTVALETDEARAAVEAAGSGEPAQLLVVPRVDGTYGAVGVIATVSEEGQLPGGMPAVALEGVARASILTGVPGTGEALWVEAEEIEEPGPSETSLARAREYRAVLENILIHRGARRFAEQLRAVTEPSRLADLAGYSPDLSFEQKVKVLETIDVEVRLELVLGWAKETLADFTLRDRIRTDVEEGLEKTQREFLLRRQLDSITRELRELSGETGARHEKLEGRELPESVREALTRELDRLDRTSEQNPEHGWITTWIDTVLDLPWEVETDDDLDLARAAEVLDADHEGLSDIKDRILEYLAVAKLRADRDREVEAGRGRGAILALVGPPGVGKTSLGESVARTLGRKFVRVSLGGIRDEAEIRGHRRTYVGAQPGRLVRALREAGSMNPVILLDEVDKIGADFRGDPASALLEVLDPAQNHTFRDHYLELDLDLSRVLFIATANVVDTIPSALLDRMEVMRIDGYTENEKVAIARRHLLDRQRRRAGLDAIELAIDDDVLAEIVSGWTREAGVRGLERELAKIARKVAAAVAGGAIVDGDAPTSQVALEDLPRLLGRRRFELDDVSTGVGIATGLAVTGTGGDVLSIEATSSSGPSGMTLTGQLGDVMKESAEIALSYLRAHAEELGIDPERLHDRHFHIHVPAGAVPKDGPSAGVTMASALLSHVTGVALPVGLGMTGEITLQGRVLPIGGVKQKLLAADRAGLTDVAVPRRNIADLEDVPEEVRTRLTVHPLSSLDDLFALAFPFPRNAALADRAA